MKKLILIALTALVFFGCAKDEKKLDFLVGDWESIDEVRLPKVDLLSGDTVSWENVQPVIKISNVYYVWSSEHGGQYKFSIEDVSYKENNIMFHFGTNHYTRCYCWKNSNSAGEVLQS